MRWLKDQGVWLLFKKATKCFPKPWCHFIPQPCPPHAHQHLVRSVYLVLSILGVLFNGCSVSTKWLCSVTQFCPTLWPHGLWAFLSVEFSRQEYWSRLPFPSSGDLPDPGIKPESPALAGGFLTSEPPGKHLLMNFYLASCVFVSRNKAAILGCVTGALISVRWSHWNRIAHWTV